MRTVTLFTKALARARKTLHGIGKNTGTLAVYRRFRIVIKMAVPKLRAIGVEKLRKPVNHVSIVKCIIAKQLDGRTF
jgi:hypothetical protein